MGRKIEDYSKIGHVRHRSDGKRLLIERYQLKPKATNTDRLKSYHWFVLSNTEIPMTIPYDEKRETRTKTWLGSGMQHDDIHCSSDYEHISYIYDPKALKVHAKIIAEKLGITI